jgi:PAS domain-containing protein
VLYLENRAPRVFAPARTAVLKLLASQAAISLENSRLCHDLADREGKIRRLVDANVLGICIWNLGGAIVAANEAFLRMLQYDRQDIVSGRLRWTDLTPTEWREQDERAVAELRSTGPFPAGREGVFPQRREPRARADRRRCSRNAATMASHSSSI